MNFKFTFFLFLLVCISEQLKSQTNADLVVEQIIESIAENTTEDFDYSELSERLNHYQKHPFNLNKVSAEQLQELAFLSPLQINALIDYRSKNGSFIELFELQSVAALDTETIKKIIQFCTVAESNPLEGITFKNLITKGSSEVMFTYGQLLQRQKGYLPIQKTDESHYAGSPQRFLSRYRYHYGNALSASLTMEKDAGERFFSGQQSRGFDFYSGNISYKGEGRLKKVIMGDYSLQFGQGLTMWSGLSFGKGAAIATITKNNIGLKPYTSTNELLFLRGMAATIKFKKLDFTPFASLRSIDGSINLADGTEKISSINATGFHRTQNELDNRIEVQQLIYGGNIQFTNKGLRLGATAYQTQFNHTFEHGKYPYNAYEFADDKLSNIGVYYNYTWRNLYLFGEAAHSFNSGNAYLNGIMSSLSPKVSLIVFHRSYQRNYHSFFNQAVSEGTNAVNEKGFYSGLVISPSKKAEFNIYADFFRFPWLRFRVDAPSSGYELLSQFSYSPSKKMTAILRYKFEQKEENDGEDNVIDFLTQVKKQNFRFELSYKISQAFQLRNRIEMMHYKKDINFEEGFLMFQDVIYKPLSSPFSGNCRFALFDTPGFNSRVYAFENDVLYSYSVPAYQNRGMRFYLNGRWRVNRATDFWFRYALTAYTNLESIGTGLDEIQGNKKSDFKLQLRFQI